jgi:hypothetical protein
MHAARSLDDVRGAWRRMEALDSGAVPTTAIGATLGLSPEHVARKIKTTAELLADRGQLPRHLRGALDAYAALVATAMCVGPCEEDATRALEARRRWKALELQIPEELLDVIEQLVSEETGLIAGRPQSLQRFGRALGWQQEKQAAAAGAALAIAACALLRHAIRRLTHPEACTPSP